VNGASERGSAIVEFQALGLVLLLPLVYVLLAVLDVQRATFAATQAAREAGRVAAVTADERAARAAAALAFDDQGLALDQDGLRFVCDGGCGTPGGSIRVTVDTVVPLPFLPPVLTDGANIRIPVRATHVAPVDRFRVSG
jgi:hypothetical protein